MPIFSEDQLIDHLQARLPQAFAQLHQAYSPALFNALIRLVKDPELAQDLLQDVFVKIWANMHQYRPEHGRLYAWMMALTRNVAIDELRQQKRLQSFLVAVTPQMTDKVHRLWVEGTFVETLLGQLRPSYRRVVELAYLQDYTHQEVADRLGMPLGTVKSQLRSALLQLKDYCRADIDLYHQI